MSQPITSTNRLRSYAQHLPAVGIAVAATLISSQLEAFINPEFGKSLIASFKKISNGDVLSVLQIVGICFLYSQIRRVQATLTERGVPADSTSSRGGSSWWMP